MQTSLGLDAMRSAATLERDAATRRLEALDATDPGRRRMVLENAPELWTVAGVAGLVSRARQATHVSVGTAESWADLSVRAAERVSGPLSMDCQVDARAELANVLRIQGRLCAAHDLLSWCLVRLDESSGDPYSRAAVMGYTASVDLAAGRWGQAVQWARLALREATCIKDDELVLRSYLKLAHVYARSERPEEALRMLARVADRVTGEEPAWMLFAFAHNILAAAADVCPERMHEWAGYLRPLLRAREPMHEPYVAWVRARSLASEGRYEEAEELLRRTVDLLVKQGSAWESGMVALDLVTVLIRSGRGWVEADAVLSDLLRYYADVPGTSPELVLCLSTLQKATRDGLATTRAVVAVQRHLGRLWC